MLKKNSRRYLIISLVLVEVISLFLAMKSFSNKEIKELKETYEVDKKHFSMFINDGSDNYTEYTSSNIFPDGYAINIDKSKCTDNKGNIIEGILSKSGSNVTVTSNKTTYCYLYFDEATAVEKILANAGDDLWDSTLEDDGYRFVGTDPNNYVCFGYSDATIDCDFTNTTNSDLYAYRIIGIFEDSEGNQHLKLIKKEALNTTYAWNADYQTDIAWNASDLYKGINGSYFLTNTTYSYMQDTNWTNKIATWNYTATNTKTYENYSANSVYGPNYYYQVIKTTYLHEMNRSSKANCYYNASTTADCNVGVWDTVSAKIGLMYVSDYQLSLGSTALDYTNNNSTHYASMKTGWMHITNNDSGAPSQHEWTMSRCGFTGSNYYAWFVNSSGLVTWNYVRYTASVRPVFYLTSDVELSGEGTSGSPFIIS